VSLNELAMSDIVSPLLLRLALISSLRLSIGDAPKGFLFLVFKTFASS
jgi:hypothetical protein